MSGQLRKAHGEDILALLAPCLHRRFFAGTYIEKRDAERVGARIQSSFSNVTVEFYHHGSGRPHMKCIAHGLLTTRFWTMRSGITADVWKKRMPLTGLTS